MKTCRVCKTEKPLDAFYASRTNRDGLQTECKACRKASVAEYQKRPDRLPKKREAAAKYRASAKAKETNRVWRERVTSIPRPRLEDPVQCSRCESFKPAEEFYADRRLKRGLHSLCKSCFQAGTKAYINSPEGRTRKRMAFHRRKSRKQAVLLEEVSPQMWAEICEAFGWRCAYCNRQEPLTMDHVDPIALQGPHSADNLVPACKSCNSSKQDTPLVFWIHKRPAVLRMK